jgi:glycosyltransferase involved in cell wall biosynthesis
MWALRRQGEVMGGMRIGMIAPLEMRVPPVAYGGTELVVSMLTEELVRRGHDVTLFASGDSETAAKLIPGCERFLRGSPRDKAILSAMNVAACFERADEFDLIHNHTSLEGLAAAGLVEVPVLTTLHGAMSGDALLLFERYRGWYNAISRSASRLLPPKERFAGVVHNAIEVARYPFSSRPREDAMLYLSRISREKGAHVAIEVARRTRRRLIVAGNVDVPDRDYFDTVVLPEVDGELVTYVGEADFAVKCELLSSAHCLLAPVMWDEPFGLFLVEAMACGTPVVALRRGSIPEVVADGVTGFVVDDVASMCEAVERVDELSPEVCRARAESQFDVPRMVDEYLAAYARILAATRPARRFDRARSNRSHADPSPAASA